MKRVIIRGGLFLLLVALPILFINYYVDAYASFRLTYKDIGKAGVNHNYSLGTEIPLSERKSKWAKVLLMEPVDCIVLGSSKSDLFSRDNLRVDDLYNFAVSGGCNINDYMAESYILYQNDMLPKHMLIEVSPRIFNEKDNDDRWLEWGNSANYMRIVLKGDKCSDNDSSLLGIQITDILSLKYFKYNMEQFIEGNRAYIKVHDSHDDEKLGTYHVDGSYSFSREYQNKYDEYQIENTVIRICEGKNIRGCSSYDTLDKMKITEFEDLVFFLKKYGVNVSLYLPPYSPQMYEYVCRDSYYHSILDAEEYLLDFAKSNGIQAYGSYDPSYCGLSLADFYDEYHVKEERISDTLFIRNDDMDDFWVRKIR